MRYTLSIFLFFNSWTIFCQFSLQGRVLNEKNEHLSYTTIYLEGTNLAAVSDEKGFYIIDSIPSGNYTLVAKFIGYRAFQQRIEVTTNIVLNITLPGEIYQLDNIEILANRIGDKGVFTNQNISKENIIKENTGVDVPYVLQWTPSLLVTSDAGTGIGYTALRLRGSDQTRINVTINGVPLNDAESHQVFWVDLPDLMSSVNNVQIQRGVGTSTNGVGAFGGAISINTNDNRINPYIDVSSGIGSFNTKKIGLKVGTGLMNDRFMIDARASYITSDGYIDRSKARLSSFFISAARVTSKSSWRLNIISGSETTNQAWFGTPESKLNGDSMALRRHFENNRSIYRSKQDSINLFNSDRRYNYYTYPNQIDNYSQSHFQLIHSVQMTQAVKMKSTLFYTKGSGYFEEFRYQDDLNRYFKDSIFEPVKLADIVRQRWLDNHLFGFMMDADWVVASKLTLQAGLMYQGYIGNHFGYVVKTTPEIQNKILFKNYYKNKGQKHEVSAYLRSIWNIQPKWTLHGDVQLRTLEYQILGNDNDLRNLDVAQTFLFLNPKIGLHYQMNKNSQLYLSLAVAHKEPSRSDFVDNAMTTLPKHERLQNWELGFRTHHKKTFFESNIYYMDYQNQLVLTGALNDVGAAIRINTPRSYRFGLENNLSYQPSKTFTFTFNATLSINKISKFEEIVADYTNGFELKTIAHQNTDISFAPTTIAALQMTYHFNKRAEITLASKYVGSQYLDNTQNAQRSLPAYHYQNLRLAYQVSSKYWKDLQVFLSVNNLLDQKYSANGYTFSYISGETITENFLYPQAGRHFMLTCNFQF